MAGLIYIDGPKLFFLVLCACVLHEAGHCAAAILAGSKVESLWLTMVGAEMELSPDISLSYARDAMISFAGPGVNLLAAWIALQVDTPLFAGLNLCFGILNLMPVRPLDGGRILTSILSFFWPVAAEKVVLYLSIVFAGFLLGIGWAAWRRWGNLSLFITAAWLVVGVLKIKK